jgi:pyrroline-5-carboxylate reductase
MSTATNPLQPSQVGVIGAGVMGEALIAALIKFGIKASSICVSEKRAERAEELTNRYGICVCDLATNVGGSDVLLLVVKPQDMASVLEEIKGSINSGALVITFAAGKSTSFISSHLGANNPVIRVMPNTPSLVGVGMSGMSRGVGVSDSEAAFVSAFLGATGKIVEVSEDLQDAITATSGSGPAYFFAFAEHMIEGAMALGLTKEVATTLTAQDIATAVATSIVAYEQTALDRFGGKFRFSQFLRSVDLSDTSITTSSAVIRGQKRFVASTVSANKYVINFNSSIHHPHDGHAYAVSSSSFTLNGLTAYFDDDGYGNLRAYSIVGNERSYINSFIGTVDYSLGIVTINSFLPTATENANSAINMTVSLDDPDVSCIRNQILLLSGATISVLNDNTGRREVLESSVATLGESTTLLQTSTSSSASY